MPPNWWTSWESVSGLVSGSTAVGVPASAAPPLPPAHSVPFRGGGLQGDAGHHAETGTVAKGHPRPLGFQEVACSHVAETDVGSALVAGLDQFLALRLDLDEDLCILVLVEFGLGGDGQARRVGFQAQHALDQEQQGLAQGVGIHQGHRQRWRRVQSHLQAAPRIVLDLVDQRSQHRCHPGWPQCHLPHPGEGLHLLAEEPQPADRFPEPFSLLDDLSGCAVALAEQVGVAFAEKLGVTLDAGGQAGEVLSDTGCQGLEVAVVREDEFPEFGHRLRCLKCPGFFLGHVPWPTASPAGGALEPRPTPLPR